MKQILTILDIDYSKSVTDIQKKLNTLHTYAVKYVGLTFLVLPTYMAWPIVALKAFANADLWQIDSLWWTSQIIFSILLIPVCVWLYKTVSYKNIHKKWVRMIIENWTGSSVIRSMEYMKEIDKFKKEI
jgi:hypothetical protein